MRPRRRRSSCVSSLPRERGAPDARSEPTGCGDARDYRLRRPSLSRNPPGSRIDPRGAALIASRRVARARRMCPNESERPRRVHRSGPGDDAGPGRADPASPAGLLASGPSRTVGRAPSRLGPLEAARGVPADRPAPDRDGGHEPPVDRERGAPEPAAGPGARAGGRLPPDRARPGPADELHAERAAPAGRRHHREHVPREQYASATPSTASRPAATPEQRETIQRLRNTQDKVMATVARIAALIREDKADEAMDSPPERRVSAVPGDRDARHPGRPDRGGGHGPAPGGGRRRRIVEPCCSPAASRPRPSSWPWASASSSRGPSSSRSARRRDSSARSPRATSAPASTCRTATSSARWPAR